MSHWRAGWAASPRMEPSPVLKIELGSGAGTVYMQVMYQVLPTSLYTLHHAAYTLYTLYTLQFRF